MDCEMCGKPATAKASVEKVLMNVCGNCAKYGTNPRPLEQKRTVMQAPSRQKEELIESVRTDVGKLLRQHRERLKLNQEQFAAKLQIRASTYNHYESGAAMPDIATARKLEHVLNVPLVVHVKVSAQTAQQEEQRGLQLGDFIKKK